MTHENDSPFSVEITERGVRFTIGVQTFTLADSLPDAQEPEFQGFLASMLTKALAQLAGVKT